jgi:hypothetical protein
LTFQPAGTPVGTQTSGDCQVNQCDGAGMTVTAADNTDVPVDNNQCTADVCTAGAPSNPPVAVDTACNQNGGAFCNGAGACVECNQASQCPGMDNECQARSCNANACGLTFQPAGTPVAAQTSGDCQVSQCDGAGAIVTAADNTDVPVDNNQCTADVCTAGAPSNPPVAVDTACSQNGGSFCNGTGACVECNQASQCPGMDNECQARSCNASTCGFTFQPAGTPVAMQTAGDCQANQCNGSGAAVSVADNTDVPVDNNQCTDDVCSMGVPSNPPTAPNTACNQTGGVICDGNGSCVAPPEVASTTPSDGGVAVASSDIQVSFSQPMNPASLTTQTTPGACSGSIQVSKDNFVTCIALSSATPMMSNGNATATLTATPGLLVNRTYKIRVTTAATSALGMPLATTYTHVTGFGTQSPNLCEGSVVISQVFGGGGSGVAVPNADYVELHNRGASPVSVAGWSVQYASAAGSGWGAITVALSGSIPPGAYYLVRMQSPQGTGTALPAPNASGGNYNMSATAGKVALVSSTTALVGNCPTSASLVDFIGYGATADCNEGGANAPALTNSTALHRAQTACADVNRNLSDFTTSAPNPRNTSSPVAACACVAHNESGAAEEADYCATQFPLSLTLAPNDPSGSVFGRLYEAGVTDPAGANASVRAQLGVGPATANPEYQGFTWTNAAFNVQVGNDDEYQASFNAPAAPGSYRYAFRFSRDNGMSWTVCDNNQAPDFGAGSNAGLSFELESLAPLTVP